MILIDNSQVILSSIFAQTKGSVNGIDESLVRHMTLNAYRNFKNKFSSKFGELVICEDSSNCWRKDHFPLYKANRKKNQNKSDVDWSSVYDTLTKVRNEIRDTFPYKNMRVPRTEADDIIAVLARRFHDQEPIMIVSGDKDFKQLQKFPNVQQYSPVQKNMIECDDPEKFLIYHIIKGDASDGIPNVLSEDDVFVCEDKRQKPCGEKKINSLMENLDPVACTENWNRNDTLINLDKIPDEIVNLVVEEWDTPIVGSKSKVFNYFIEHKLKNLMGDIQEF